MAIRHRPDVDCDMLLCLPERHPDHYWDDTVETVAGHPPTSNAFWPAPELPDVGHPDDGPVVNPDGEMVRPGTVIDSLGRMIRPHRAAEELVPYLWPMILERLRGIAPEQARDLAIDADRASLMAPADWLTENKWADLGREVARVHLEGGALVVLRSDTVTDVGTKMQILKRLKASNPEVAFLIVDPGWDVATLKWLPRATDG